MDKKSLADKQNDLKLVSDENLQAVTANIVNGQAILVAYKIGLFDYLTDGPKSIFEVSNYLKIEERSAQVLISCACVYGFICLAENLYSLTDLGAQYFRKDSEFFYGPVFDLLIENASIMDFDSIEKAVKQSHPIVDDGVDIFSDDLGIGNQDNFIRALHQKSISSAFFWPQILDLSNCSTFIDIGGGSGVHTIGACLHNANLKGVVCDRSAVLNHTRQYIDKYQLSNRVDTRELDLFTCDQFPTGDVHFYGDIFHDWSSDICLSFARKSYASLPSGGRIILHEMLFDERKSGPALTAGYNLKMLLWTQGQQFSFEEISKILSIAGFTQIKRDNSLGNWSIIYAYK